MNSATPEVARLRILACVEAHLKSPKAVIPYRGLHVALRLTRIPRPDLSLLASRGASGVAEAEQRRKEKACAITKWYSWSTRIRAIK